MNETDARFPVPVPSNARSGSGSRVDHSERPRNRSSRAFEPGGEAGGGWDTPPDLRSRFAAEETVPARSIELPSC